MIELAATRRTTARSSVCRDRMNRRSEMIRALDAIPEPTDRRSRAAKPKTRGRLADHASWSRRMNWM